MIEMRLEDADITTSVFAGYQAALNVGDHMLPRRAVLRGSPQLHRHEEGECSETSKEPSSKFSFLLIDIRICSKPTRPFEHPL